MLTVGIPIWIKGTVALIGGAYVINVGNPPLGWVISALLPILGFIVSEYWAERREVKRFYLEKNHEIISKAYDEIIRALHDQVSYFTFKCYYCNADHDDIPEERSSELLQKHLNATRVLDNARQLGTLYVSSAANAVLITLANRNQPNPYEVPDIDFNSAELDSYKSALNEMLSIASSELKRPSSK